MSARRGSAAGYPQIADGLFKPGWCDGEHRWMSGAATDLDDLFARHGGVASTAQLTTIMTRKPFGALVRSGQILRVCRGVYSDHVPGVADRLAALDILAGIRIVACMNTAAALHGFDTENDDRLHILDPGLR